MGGLEPIERGRLNLGETGIADRMAERSMIPAEVRMTAARAQQVFSETRTRRDEARALLRALMDAKTRAEQAGPGAKPLDSLEHVTGRSSMDKAIESTRRLIDSFNRVLDDLCGGMTEEDLALLAEIETDESGPAGVVLGRGG